MSTLPYKSLCKLPCTILYTVVFLYYNIPIYIAYCFRSAKKSGDGSRETVDLKSRLNITLAAYDLKGKLLYVDEAASANIFQMCNGSFIEFDAAFNFGTRYE